MTLQPGTRLGHYEITSLLGSGGMGEVYRAHDEHLDRDVAIKVLPSVTLSDDQTRKRFRKEALALSKLNHPNIATIHDFGTREGADFIVMELVEGTTLAKKVKTGPLPEKDVAGLGAQIADALEEAHERGIVHRDLKPGNIAITQKDRVKVLDFGLARMFRPVSDEATTEALTQEHAVAGTLPYMAPEELLGEGSDRRSDLYSLGVVLYEMATGRRPFEHTLSTALADAIIHKSAEPPSAHNRQISSELERAIVKALDKDPGRRYQSARKMRVDLERLTAPAKLVEPEPKTKTSRWFWAATAAVIVAALIAIAIFVVGADKTLEIDSIAVLPFENLSGDPEQEYFVDGMTDEIIAQLARISALKIISRTSVMQYKDVHKPLTEIAQELNVGSVVEGSVRRSEDAVRITVQLIDAASDQHIWAQSYEREMKDIFAIQNDVAQKIASALKAALSPEEKLRIENNPTENIEAHNLFLKGRYFWNKRTEEGFFSAIEYYEQALDIDPNYALAYAGIAGCYNLIGWHDLLPSEEVYPKAKAAAEEALLIDNNLSEAHASLAYTHVLYDWDWLAAEKEYKRALEINPNDAAAHMWYAEYLAYMGRHDESIAEARKAQELDPLSLGVSHNLGLIFYEARQHDLAIEAYQNILHMDANYIVAHNYLGLAYAGKKMYGDAIAEIQKAIELSVQRSPLFLGTLGAVYSFMGNRNEAEKILEELLELSKHRYIAPVSIAIIYGGLGQKDQAFEWMEKGYKVRDDWMAVIQVSPRFDPLRDDPRFQDLLRRMNFPE